MSAKGDVCWQHHKGVSLNDNNHSATREAARPENIGFVKRLIIIFFLPLERAVMTCREMPISLTFPWLEKVF